MAVAVLGSETVDVREIDESSILLEGIAPKPWPRPRWRDVGTAGGDRDCVCHHRPELDEDSEDESAGMWGNAGDGYIDLVLFFDKPDIAAAIGADPPPTGAEIRLTLTGAYEDGMPFETSDCVLIVGGDDDSDSNSDDTSASADDVADMRFPSPNPFNPVTRISYSISTTRHVRLGVFDVTGRLVEELVNETKQAGRYVAEWDAGNVPSGVYFFRLQLGNQIITQRASLLK
jgi:hypothetical protein